MTFYVVDTNMLYSKIESIGKNRNDIVILDEIAIELSPVISRVEKLKKAGVQFISLKKTHYDKLKVVMQSHGKNLNLIRLYTNEGAGDIEIISYILAERENNPPLFKNDYNLVTKDVAAIKVAKSYGITCLDYIPSKDTK